MISTIVVALVVAVIQVISHKMTAGKIKTAIAAAEAARDHARDAAAMADAADVQSRAALELLQPAVAQLPKTRSKKGKPGDDASGVA